MHVVEVVHVKLEPHPHADSLSLVKVHDYTVCVKTKLWIGIDKGAYIPPDSLVNTTRSEFAFLRKDRDIEKIRARKFCNIVSYGLLIPAPVGSRIGDNVAELLGVEHYEPELIISTRGESTKGPPGVYHIKYDLDNSKTCGRIIPVGTSVCITEKINGANGKYVFCLKDKNMYCGSRSNWKKNTDESIWWKILKKYPQIEELCRVLPNHILYGEVYGGVSCMRYGKKDIDFVAFDIMRPDGTFLNVSNFLAECEFYQIPVVPIISLDFPYEYDKMKEISDGPSVIKGANHYREGVVVVPMEEIIHDRFGRVKIKFIGETYSLRDH